MKTNSSSRQFARLRAEWGAGLDTLNLLKQVLRITPQTNVSNSAKVKSTFRRFVLAICASVFLSNASTAQIFVNYGSGVAEYGWDGTPINTNFISSLSRPQGILINGSTLFVANNGTGTIGEYDLASGALLNTIPAVLHLEGLAISGSNLYAAEYQGSIGEYPLSGGAANTNLISKLKVSDGIAIVGTNLYITCRSNVALYSTSGAVINSKLIPTVPDICAGITIVDTNIYLAQWESIGKYTLTGAPVNISLVTNLNGANGITSDGKNLYIICSNGVVGEYALDGTAINASLFTVPGLAQTGYYPFGIAVIPPCQISLALSPQSSPQVTLGGVVGFKYSIQRTANLANSISWVTVTNLTLTQPSQIWTDSAINTTLPTNSSYFYRVLPGQ